MGKIRVARLSRNPTMSSAENPKDHKRQPPREKSEDESKRREGKETFIAQTLAWLEESDATNPPQEENH